MGEKYSVPKLSLKKIKAKGYGQKGEVSRNEMGLEGSGAGDDLKLIKMSDKIKLRPTSPGKTSYRKESNPDTNIMDERMFTDEEGQTALERARLKARKKEKNYLKRILND